MQNLFICKFSGLKIQFFRPYPFSLPPARHFPPIRLATRPRPSSASASLILVELGFLCTQHGTGKAWLTSQTGCARHSVRGSPGSPNEYGEQGLLFGECGSPVQSSFLGIVPVGVYCQICILKKYCHADCGRRTLWGARAPEGRRTLWGERTRRSQNLFEACAH